MRKLSNLHPFFFYRLSIKILSCTLFYLCRSCKQNNWWRHKVGHA